MVDHFMQRHVLLQSELKQRQEEGCDVSALEADVNALGHDIADDVYNDWWSRLDALTPSPAFPYVEPSDLDGIREQRPHAQPNGTLPDDHTLQDKMLGAWLGRAAGCQLGKPVEGWPKARIESYLQGIGDYPLRDYFRAADHPGGLRLHDFALTSTRGHITENVRDDDTDYTILGLHILESCGLDFTTQDVASSWLDLLPYNRVYTAERVAYRNLVDERPLDEVPVWRNPYREWIGAQIRADGFAYAAAANPEKAAEFAWRDARLSHVKNGIYGEMWAAAAIAAAFAAPIQPPSPEQIARVLQTGLAQIPRQSRLAEAIHDVLAWRQQTEDWRTAWDWLNQKYGHYHPVHTINNAAVVALALLYGDGDFTGTVGIAVMGGWDTDCNGATAGSILGAIIGARALPEHWVHPLNDSLRSALIGFDRCSITGLAARSIAVGRLLLRAVPPVL